MSKSFFENKKLIIIKDASDKIKEDIEVLKEKILDDIKIIFISGVLDKKSKLRNLFEKDNDLVAIAFYNDSNETLSAISKSFFLKKNISISQESITLLVNRAYGEFNRLVKIQTDNGIELGKAQGMYYKDIQDKLVAGGFAESDIEKRLGKTVRSEDINADREYLKSDINKVPNQAEFVSLNEKQALSDLKRHYLYGEPFPSYFKGVTKNTSLSAEQYADDRFRATGGYTKDDEIAQRFITNDEGILIDPQYGLTKGELNELEVKPHLTKTYGKLLDPEKTKGILEGF